MILITGATGHLGKATLHHLAQKTAASQLVALARDESKASSLKEQGIRVRIGSFDEPESLEKAMEGITKVLLISGTDPQRLQQHKNVVNAAQKAGVQQLVYTGVSLQNLDASALKTFMGSHFETEAYIKASGIPYTFLRNTLYLDGIPFFVGEKVLETGIALPAGSGKVPYALRDEMAEAAANVLVEAGHTHKTYEITGSEAYSYTDVAQALTELSGKTVSYTPITEEAFIQTMKQYGVPDYLIDLVNGFSVDTKNGLLEASSTDLQTLLGRKPATLKEGLQAIYPF